MWHAQEAQSAQERVEIGPWAGGEFPAGCARVDVRQQGLIAVSGARAAGQAFPASDGPPDVGDLLIPDGRDSEAASRVSQRAGQVRPRPAARFPQLPQQTRAGGAIGVAHGDQ